MRSQPALAQLSSRPAEAKKAAIAAAWGRRPRDQSARACVRRPARSPHTAVRKQTQAPGGAQRGLSCCLFDLSSSLFDLSDSHLNLPSSRGMATAVVARSVTRPSPGRSMTATKTATTEMIAAEA